MAVKRAPAQPSARVLSRLHRSSGVQHHPAKLAGVLRTAIGPASLAGQPAVRSTRAQHLDRQDRLSPFCREVDLKRVGVEGQ